MIDLRCGDCLEEMKTMPDKSIDMILCDLPYGTTACKWDNVIPFEPYHNPKEIAEEFRDIHYPNCKVVKVEIKEK